MVARAPQSVIGYHGCSRDTADAILAGEPFTPSVNTMDWLGRGIYFWEYGPYRALEWATEHHAQPAVLEAEIDLGICLNLLDRQHFDGVVRVYEAVAKEHEQLGFPLPVNTQRGAHFLDRIVINAYCDLSTDPNPPFQTVRGCFPEGIPIYEGSRIQSKSHVQVAVREGSCIRVLRRVDLETELLTTGRSGHD